jgi:HAD superfamily hydrolase (TIGR01490 family)
MTAVAFFDVDRTLIPDNSGVLWARFERRHGRIRRRQLLKATVLGALYHFDLIDIDKAYAEALAHYRGMPAAELRAWTHRWFDEEIAGRILPGARAAIEMHRRAGHPVVLLTNGSIYAAERGASHWHADDWLANRFTLDAEGRLTGAVEPPLCYGAGKVTRARAWLADRHPNATLGDCWFYSDALSDLPMLEAVGHPVVVRPDPRLRRVAMARGWPICAFDSADAPAIDAPPPPAS